MAPVVDGLKKQYEGIVEFELYDVEKSKEGADLATRFGVQYVPTFVFVREDGTVANTIVGEVAESKLRAALDALR